MFTQAQFTVPLPTSVQRGDSLGYEPIVGGDIFVEVKAVACSSPLTAHVDVRPSSSANRVYPRQWQSLVPVRVYGSSTIDVTKASRVRLGRHFRPTRTRRRT